MSKLGGKIHQKDKTMNIFSEVSRVLRERERIKQLLTAVQGFKA